MNTFIKREYDYAIRICAYLAGHFQKGHIPISQIATNLYLTRPFTTKIVYQLKKAGIVDTVQGKVGGVFLIHPPQEISVYTVLKAMGFSATINECLQKNTDCPLASICRIQHFFAQQQNLLIENFKTKKISEFALNDTDLIPVS
ncbi:MAG: Rrf2 family transcriptional regulator [Calditrichaeota bacterium]|nr:Rrf2 family transcriptional regulator [Calditrichota bacterium]